MLFLCAAGAVACGPQPQEAVFSDAVTAQSCVGCHDAHAVLDAPVLTSTVIWEPLDPHYETTISCVDCHGTGATQGRGVILGRRKR